MNDVDCDQWIKAMDLEMESMYSNSVWTLVDQPNHKKPIGCKWIYKRKRDQASKVQTFKARLVAKGYTQKEGVDYEETFSPVAMLKSIRILLSIATFYDYEIWQMDVKTAFLNGNLEESIYIVQPEGFIQKSQEQKVCHLTDIKKWLAMQFQMKDLGNAQYDELVATHKNEDILIDALGSKEHGGRVRGVDGFVSQSQYFNTVKGMEKMITPQVEICHKEEDDSR
ncbi:gag/pol protein [Cucumis melo var. makuwa]|uniref:Gag/pol protein n=1 Tax=Cucumis melo var. makuwa TaxID=1194695 RepID=A0A5D3C5F1_CUCMM|nr:gag/pol protein [Cucumis melo var. makuwa]TYK06570.1 gag/pol protein [Cucumis melo var. makuwa]